MHLFLVTAGMMASLPKNNTSQMLQFSEVQGQHRVGMGSTASLWQVFPRHPAQLRSPSTVIYHKDNILHCPQCSCDKQ